MDPALAGAITAIVVSIIGVIASRRKDDAVVASQLTGSALDMVESARADCRDLRERLRKTELKIEQLENENKILHDYVDELIDGILILGVQLADNGIEPKYKPGERPVFRGG